MTAPASIRCPRCGAVSYHARDVAERYCGRCHQFHEFFRAEADGILAGHYYGDDGRRLHDLGTLNAEPVPDQIVSRRLADFPGGVAPAGGTLDRCPRCHQAIVTNRAKFPTVPRICMQCAHIQPLPLES